MDQHLLGLLMPGHVAPVDLRCHRRLEAALRQPTNPFRRTGVAVLDALVRGRDADENPHPLAAWWDLNLCTSFFRHSGTARAIRKAGEESEPL
jgi:hypothetical protein